MSDDEEPRRVSRLQRASTVKKKPQHWLWHNRLPIGAFTLLGAREGEGKSTLALDIAARVSNGELFPNAERRGLNEGRPGHVIIVSIEDSIESVTVPRLEGMGADLDNIDFFTMRHEGKSDILDLSRDMKTLAADMRRLRTRLVIFDPIKSFLGDINENNPTQLRNAIQPLNHLAEKRMAALMGIIHFNKGSEGDMGQMISGRLEWSQVARATVGVKRDPDNKTEFVFGNGKNNNAPGDVPSLRGTTTTVEVPVGDEAGNTIEVPCIKWLGESKVSIHDMINPPKSAHKSEIDEWLKNLLDDNDGVMNVADINQRRKDEGICAERTLRNAKRRLNLDERPLGFGKGFAWALPTDIDISDLTNFTKEEL